MKVTYNHKANTKYIRSIEIACITSEALILMDALRTYIKAEDTPVGNRVIAVRMLADMRGEEE